MADKDDFKLAENLERLMAEKRVREATVAKKIGMNKSTLHNYCNGVMPRHLTKLKALADYFGVTLDELLFGVRPLRTSHRLEVGDVEGRFEITVKRLK